jgi:hypothetical protein
MSEADSKLRGYSMANYIVYVPVRRIVDIFNILRPTGEAALLDYRLITLRSDFEIAALERIIRAAESDLTFFVAEVQNCILSGDGSAAKAASVWKLPIDDPSESELALDFVENEHLLVDPNVDPSNDSYRP